jgi:molybdopterin/thiamine biosynthesis adenylyltransferase
MELDRKRYARQIVLPEVGVDGQKALSEAKVLCVGAGGLGSPVLLYLAAAGVGTLGMIDDDRVEASNLQRQILFEESDVGILKTEAAQARIKAQNPNINCVQYPFQLTAANAREILSRYDVVIDGTDNFSTKFLINDACASLGLPWVYGSVNRWEGQVSSFSAKEGPCYRCLYPQAPTAKTQNCAEAGVLGATVGVVGSWQAILALRIILPGLRPQWGNLQVINTLSSDQLNVQIQKNPDCATCSKTPHEIEIQDSAVQKIVRKIRADEVVAEYSKYQLIDVRTSEEWNGGHLPRAHHWPLSEIENGKFPKERKLVLYCQSGMRSERAAQLLAGAGYTDVVELKGGVSEWPAALE